VDASFALNEYVDASLNNIRTNYTTTMFASILDASIGYIVSNYATTDFVTTRINTLLNSVPDALDSLNELANALNSDVSFGYNTYAKIASSDASINNIRTNYPTNDYVDGSLNNIRTNYPTNDYVDGSLNNIRTNYALSSTLDDYTTNNNLTSNYPTNTYVDGSLNNIRNNLTGIVSTAGNVNIAPVTAFNVTTPMSYINGNLDIGTGSNLIGINKDVADGFHLDISGNLRVSNTITGVGFIGTSFQPSAVGTAITVGDNITTGNISIGFQQTSGNLNLGTGTGRTTGNIFIGTGTTNASNTINIGRGNVISIVNSTNQTLTVNRPIRVNYTYPISDTTMIGYQVSFNNTSFTNPWGVTTPPIPPIGNVSGAGLSLTPGVWNLSGYCHIQLINNCGITFGLSTANNAFNTGSGLLPTQTAIVNSNVISSTNYWQVNTVYYTNANTTIYFLFQPNTTQSGITFTRAGVIATRIA
jgi:hypothetical protein